MAADGVRSQRFAARFSCGELEQREVAPKRALGTLQLLGMMFVACVGGPYGIEGVVKYGGGLGTLLALIVVPWAWGLPTALVVTELSTAIPANSGSDAWISVSYPTSFTLMSMTWTFFINRCDNGLYPNLFVSYIVHSFVPLTWWWRTLLKLVFVVACAVPNIFAVDAVGNASLVLMCVALLPFVILSAAEPFQEGFSAEHMVEMPSGGVRWSLFFPYVVWNLSGYDSVGHITEEIECASKRLIKALLALLGISQVCYGLPVLSGLSIHHRTWANASLDAHSYDEWDDGYLVTIAGNGYGGWLANMMSVGAVASSVGMMVALLCTTSRALQGHAMLGIFPQRVNKFLCEIHPTYRTPVNAVVVNAVLCFLVSAAAEFDLLLGVGTVLYCLRLLAVMGSAILLRMRHPTLPRPFKIPLGTVGLTIILVPAFLFCTAATILSAVDTTATMWLSGVLIACSALVSWALSRYTFPCGLDSKIVYDRADGQVEAKMEDFDAKNGGLALAVISPTSEATPTPLRGMLDDDDTELGTTGTSSEPNIATSPIAGLLDKTETSISPNSTQQLVA